MKQHCPACDRPVADSIDLETAKKMGIMVGGVGTVTDPPRNRRMNSYDPALCYASLARFNMHSSNEERKRCIQDCRSIQDCEPKGIMKVYASPISYGSARICAVEQRLIDAATQLCELQTAESLKALRLAALDYANVLVEEKRELDIKKLMIAETNSCALHGFRGCNIGCQ